MSVGDFSLYDDLVGVPWVRDGRDKSGLDCTGLVLEVLKRIGILVPDPVAIITDPHRASAHELLNAYQMFQPVIPPYRLGDVAVIRLRGELADHLGVFVDPVSIMQAGKEVGVTITPLERMQSKLDCVLRYDNDCHG